MDWVARHTRAPGARLRRSCCRCRARVRNRLLWLSGRRDRRLARALARRVRAASGPAARRARPSMWSVSWPLGDHRRQAVRARPAARPGRRASCSRRHDRRRSCVQVYSLGYMHDDARKGWYFAVLSLFTAAMLALVLADNLLLIFMTWEIMGLCSYLLIGFWYEHEAPRKASQKAFLTTRVGDIGFLFALFVDLRGDRHVRARRRPRARCPSGRRASRRRSRDRPAARRDGQVGAGAAARLAARRDGRPDAGLGAHPRGDDGRRRRLPRGAHAARSSRQRRAVLDGHAGHRHDHRARRRAARAACSTTSRRCSRTRRSASSATCSSRWAPASAVAALFHLMTHAFFKSLLFLGAGVIIHAAHTQDMREMGGLAQAHAGDDARRSPIGSLALAGVFPLVRLLQQGRDPHGAAARAATTSTFVARAASSAFSPRST